MSIPQVIEVVGVKEFNDPDVLFIRKCVQCGNVFYIRTVQDDHCTRCGSSDTIIQTRDIE